MKRLTLLLLVPLVGLAATPARAGTTMNQSIVASGGTASSNTHYRLDATLAQSAVGVVTGGHRIEIGYWRVLGFVTSDVPGPPSSTVERFALGEIRPNPLQPGSTLSLLLPTRAHVQVTLYDIAGRAAMEVVDADLGPGTVRVALPGRS